MNKLYLKLKIYLSEFRSMKYNNKFFGYPLIKNNDYYSIYRHPEYGSEILAACDKSIVLKKNNTLLYFPNVADKSFKVRLPFTDKLFPNLIQGSKIDKCLLIPYMRAIGVECYKKSIRLVIITDKGQIYHNYPARSSKYDGASKYTDINKFEQSVVWDLPSGRYPSKNENCDCFERFFPGLPDSCYDYSPVPNDSNQYIDKYGNGGFGKCFSYYDGDSKIILPRFYVHSRNPQANSFHFIGGSTFDCKMNFIGTYRSNTDVGVRTCLFATDDGGRNWFCKFEFADLGDYNFRQGNESLWGQNFGNHIMNLQYDKIDICNSLSFVKRNLVFDHTNFFSWKESILLSEITNDKYLTFKSREKHGLVTGNIIAFFGKNNLPSKLNWLINNECGSTSTGNNLFFKVKVIDDFTFEVLECVSQSTHNICCRHIHHVNRVKDGWLCGTGEIYPNGWLLYIQMKQADTFSIKRAWEKFDIIILNGSKQSVQRTMGAIIDSNKDINIIYASDHDTLSTEPYIFNDNTSLSRNSTGVFKGKLKNINNRDKFSCIFEAKEPCFFFQNLNGKFIFCGQRGELAISFDKGISWHEDRLDNLFLYYYGYCYDYLIFDKYVIKFKK